MAPLHNDDDDEMGRRVFGEITCWILITGTGHWLQAAGHKETEEKWGWRMGVGWSRVRDEEGGDLKQALISLNSIIWAQDPTTFPELLCNMAQAAHSYC